MDSTLVMDMDDLEPEASSNTTVRGGDGALFPAPWPCSLLCMARLRTRLRTRTAANWSSSAVAGVGHLVLLSLTSLQRLQLRVVHPGGPTSTLRQGDVYALRPGENTVGRSSACHVHLPYAFVSKLHARLHVGDEEVRLHAEGSNGTSLVVNGLVTAVKVRTPPVLRLAH